MSVQPRVSSPGNKEKKKINSAFSAIIYLMKLFSGPKLTYLLSFSGNLSLEKICNKKNVKLMSFNYIPSTIDWN
jgi:hypothetical protein